MADTTLDSQGSGVTLKDIEYILKKGKPIFEFRPKGLSGVLNHIVDLKRYYRATLIQSSLTDSVTSYELTLDDEIVILHSVRADLKALKEEYPALNLDAEIAAFDNEINKRLGTEN